MSAEDPIASSIGHGAHGFRSNLRDWFQLSGESERQPQTFVELRPAIVVTGWQAATNRGAITHYYATLVAPQWDGATLDIVAVDTELRRLTRVQTLALCQATSSSFHHDATGSLLNVNVTAAEMPLVDAAATAFIVARPGIYFGTDSATLPVLGPDMMVNGGFDAGGLAGWATYSGYGAPVPTFDPTGDTTCLHLFSTSIATSSYAYQDVATVAAATYCVSASYIVGANGGRVTIADGGTGANIVGPDGRSYGAVAGQDLAPPFTIASQDSASERNQRRRFSFYFIARTSSTRIQLGALSGTAAVSAKFDSVRLQRVYSWQRAQPLLPSSGVPSIDEGREDLWWGRVRTGQGQFRVLNDGGALGVLLGAYDFAGAEVVFRHGGRFSQDAEEITPEQLRVGFVGRVRELELSESALMLRCEDTRGVALALVPARKYTRQEFPDLDARYDSAVRPLAFGWCRDVPPARIGTNGVADPAALGRYEVADVDGLPYGIAVEDAARPARVWLYLDDAAATRNDVTHRTDVTDHVSWDAANGRFDLAKCCKAVPLEGMFFSVAVDGGAQLDVLLTPSQQETIIQTPIGITAVTNWGPGGSAVSALSGIQFEADGAWANSVSTTGHRYLDCSFDSVPGASAAVQSVELRARVRPTDPFDPETSPIATVKLYVDVGATGTTRYYASPYLENPGNAEFIEISFKWTEDPSSPGTPLDDTWNDNARFGVEFRSVSGGYMNCDLLQRHTVRISASAPTSARPGVLSPSQTVTALAAAINAAASVTTVASTFDESTRLYTVTKTGGSLTLYTKTGRSPNGWEQLRFRTDADSTGLLTYTSVDPYYSSPDDLDASVLRVDFLGAADDTSGTYTGQASAPIERGPDVIRYILQEHLRVPADQIVTGSFAGVRAARTGVVSLYVWQPSTFEELVGLIEAHDRADLVIDGLLYRYDVRPTTLGAYSPLLYDREILSLSMKVALEDVASSVVVSYAPGSQVGRGTVPGVEVAVVGVRALYGSADRIELACASASETEAAALRDAVAASATRPPRVAEITAYGDVVALRVGEVFGLRATAGVVADSSGSLDVTMRVVRRKVDAEMMTASIMAVEVLPDAAAAVTASATARREPFSPHVWAPWNLGPGHMQRR